MGRMVMSKLLLWINEAQCLWDLLENNVEGTFAISLQRMRTGHLSTHPPYTPQLVEAVPRPLIFLHFLIVPTCCLAGSGASGRKLPGSVEDW